MLRAARRGIALQFARAGIILARALCLSVLFLICRNQAEIGQVFSYFCNYGGIDKILRCVLEILRTDRNPV